MTGFLKQDFSAKVISVVAAILFWIVVFNIDNEFVDKSVTVSLNVINEEHLNKKGIVLLSEIPKNINLTVRGRENAVSAVTSGDFMVTVDLGEIKTADEKQIQVSQPVFDLKDIYVSKYNKNIDIELERIVTQTFPVKVRTIGSLKEGYRLTGITHTPRSFEISGLESVINSIEGIEAVIDLGEISEDISVERLCKVYDKKGSLIQTDSYMNIDSIKVKAQINIGRQITVLPLTTGYPAEGYYVSSKNASPGKVTVAGAGEVLKNLTTLYTQAVDISNSRESISMVRDISLPEGVKIVEPADGVEVSVGIKKMKDRRFRVPAGGIKLSSTYTDGSYYYEIIDDHIYIEVRGRQEDIDALTQEEVNVFADASGLQDGMHGVPVTVELPERFLLVSSDTVIIKVEQFKTIELPVSVITITGKKEGYEYSITGETHYLVIRGRKQVLDRCTVESLEPILDVSMLDSGQAVLKLLVQIPDGITVVEGEFVTVIVEPGKTPSQE